MIGDSVFLLTGFVLLIAGGELLVRGSVGIANMFGMSPLLIGITLVGFGTSAPELVISVQASLAGSPGIAVGNIVGSCLSNILLILGVAALLAPLPVRNEALRRDGMVVLVTAVLFACLGLFYSLDRIAGGVFLILLAAYLRHAYLQEMEWQRVNGHIAQHTAAYAVAEAQDADPDDTINVIEQTKIQSQRVSGFVWFAAALAGLAIIFLGGRLLVDGAVGIARALQVSEAVIGLTIVAIGTSMPELVTCAVAALRNQSEVAIGNIMGSNVYNVLGIGGATGLLAPTTIPEQIKYYDNFILVAASIALIVLARSDAKITRLEGLLLLCGYVAYIASIWPM